MRFENRLSPSPQGQFILPVDSLQDDNRSLRWMIAAAVWSYVDEAMKPWIQGRHFSWFDVGMNLIGTFISVIREQVKLLGRVCEDLAFRAEIAGGKRYSAHRRGFIDNAIL